MAKLKRIRFLQTHRVRSDCIFNRIAEHRVQLIQSGLPDRNKTYDYQTIKSLEKNFYYKFVKERQLK